MHIDLSGRKALVTGAGQGIGRGIAQALQSTGAEVSAVDIDGAALAALDATPVATAVLDVTDLARVAAFVEASGGFDIVVHVAGGVRGQRFEVFLAAPELPDPVFVRFEVR